MAGVASIAAALGAHRSGRNWCCACPLDCGYALSLAEGDDGKLLAYCHGGHEFEELRTALVEYGLLDPDDDPPEQFERELVEKVNAKELTQRIEAGAALYKEARPAAGTIAEKYIREVREIPIFSDALRLHPCVRHRIGVYAPALIAPILGGCGAFLGAHLTYLKPDGSGKADFHDSALQRDIRGVARGGCIRLAPHNPKRELALGEGVESTLSGMALFDLPGWSAVSAAGLKTVELPSAVQHILIIADHNESGCSQRCATEAAQRLRSEGRKARIWLPTVVGDDANDVLRKKRRG